MKKSSNHAKAPKSAAFIQELRKVFGEEHVEFRYVREGGLEIGEKSDDSLFVPVSA